MEKENKQISLDLRIELAKNEYVSEINKINEKYELPLSLVEMILGGICNEVHVMKVSQLEKEQLELNKDK